jgi:hypothetical protein
MDPQLSSTAERPEGGVFDRELARADIPVRREVLMCTESLGSGTDLVHALETGRLLVSRERYGIVCGWKKAEGDFRGVLLQHKSVMEDRSFVTAEDLRSWFLTTVYAVE